MIEDRTLDAMTKETIAQPQETPDWSKTREKTPQGLKTLSNILLIIFS